MKVGQKVKIKDGSYMATINKSGDVSHYGLNESTKTIGWNNDVWDVLAIEGRYPITCVSMDKEATNDTIIMNTENKEIWYCNSEINLTKYNDIPELTMDELINMVGFDFKLIK